MQIKTLDEVLVVQRGALNCRSCQLHGIHIRHRCDGPCTANLIGDFIQAGTHTFCLELIGDGPARTLGGKT